MKNAKEPTRYSAGLMKNAKGPTRYSAGLMRNAKGPTRYSAGPTRNAKELMKKRRLLIIVSWSSLRLPMAVKPRRNQK